MSGMIPMEVIAPILVSEDTVYPRERIDHPSRLMLFQRPQTATPFQQAMRLQVPRPAPQLFEDRFASVYSVTEAYAQQAKPIPPQPFFIWQPSNRVADPEPEDSTRRFHFEMFFTYRTNLVPFVSVVGFAEDIPDLCDNPWLEWVPPPIDHALRMFPMRQYIPPVGPQPWALLSFASPNYRPDLDYEPDLELLTYFRSPHDDWEFQPFRNIFPVGPFPAVALEGFGDVNVLGTINLEWSASPGAFGYRVYVNGVPEVAFQSGQSKRYTGLLVGVPYTFNVVAVNSRGVDASSLSNNLNYAFSPTQSMVVTTFPWGNTPEQGYIIDG